jgi:Flp pilus assembly pilin Flp
MNVLQVLADNKTKRSTDHQIVDEQGQSLGEVALFLALVVVVAIVALTGLGQSIVDILNQVANAI